LWGESLSRQCHKTVAIGPDARTARKQGANVISAMNQLDTRQIGAVEDQESKALVQTHDQQLEVRIWELGD